MKSIPEEVLRAALEGAVRGGGSMAACRAFVSLIGAVFTGRLFKKPQEAIKELVRRKKIDMCSKKRRVGDKRGTLLVSTALTHGALWRSIYAQLTEDGRLQSMFAGAFVGIYSGVRKG